MNISAALSIKPGSSALSVTAPSATGGAAAFAALLGGGDAPATGGQGGAVIGNALPLAAPDMAPDILVAVNGSSPDASPLTARERVPAILVAGGGMSTGAAPLTAPEMAPDVLVASNGQAAGALPLTAPEMAPAILVTGNGPLPHASRLTARNGVPVILVAGGGMSAGAEPASAPEVAPDVLVAGNGPATDASRRVGPGIAPDILVDPAMPASTSAATARAAKTAADDGGAARLLPVGRAAPGAPAPVEIVQPAEPGADPEASSRTDETTSPAAPTLDDAGALVVDSRVIFAAMSAPTAPVADRTPSSRETRSTGRIAVSLTGEAAIAAPPTPGSGLSPGGADAAAAILTAVAAATPSPVRADVGAEPTLAPAARTAVAVADDTPSAAMSRGHAALESGSEPRLAPTPPVSPVASAGPPLAAGAVAPAGEVFAAAIHAAGRSQTDPRSDVAPFLPMAAEAPIAAAIAATGNNADPSLDLGRHDWPGAMIDHIERLRDAADAVDTRIRLVPDALGGIEVSLRRHDDGIQVTLAADQPATQAILAEARPRLDALAEARGIRLADAAPSGANGGLASGSQGGWGGDPSTAQDRPRPAAFIPAAPPGATPADPIDPADGRVA